MGAALPIPQDPSPPLPPTFSLVSPLDAEQREAIREIVSDMLIAAVWEQQGVENPAAGGAHG